MAWRLLGEPEMVRIKGADEPVVARRLVAAGAARADGAAGHRFGWT